MTFPDNPGYSSNKITKAGRIIAHEDSDSRSYRLSRNIVDEWRAAHAYPLHIIAARLRKDARLFKGAIVAQRLKRMPTIIDKICYRERAMALASMRDIAGARVILRNMNDVRKFLEQYQQKSRFKHEQEAYIDYVEPPKASGYRGVHVVYRYNGREKNPEKAGQYAGMRIEVQVRTKLQHTWATSVETFDMLRGVSYKTQGGDDDWAKFFQLLASLFALYEDCPVLDAHTDMSPAEIARKVIEMNRAMGVTDSMLSTAFASNVKDLRKEKSGYVLILLHHGKKRLRITHYDDKYFSRADEHYRKLELETKDDDSANVVLVSVSDLHRIRKAYPNYFADIKELATKLDELEKAFE